MMNDSIACYIIGTVMIFAGGGLLHDVPFMRFLPAMMLAIVGTQFLIVAGSLK